MSKNDSTLSSKTKQHAFNIKQNVKEHLVYDNDTTNLEKLNIKSSKVLLNI